MPELLFVGSKRYRRVPRVHTKTAFYITEDGDAVTRTYDAFLDAWSDPVIVLPECSYRGQLLFRPCDRRITLERAIALAWLADNPAARAMRKDEGRPATASNLRWAGEQRLRVLVPPRVVAVARLVNEGENVQRVAHRRCVATSTAWSYLYTAIAANLIDDPMKTIHPDICHALWSLAVRRSDLLRADLRSLCAQLPCVAMNEVRCARLIFEQMELARRHRLQS